MLSNEQIVKAYLEYEFDTESAKSLGVSVKTFRQHRAALGLPPIHSSIKNVIKPGDKI